LPAPVPTLFYSQVLSSGQVDDALKIVNQGIVCCALKYGKYDDEYLAKLFCLRLHVAELDLQVLDKVQCCETLLQVMARCPTYTVLYDILRCIFGESQSNDKLDTMLRLMRESVQSGDFGYPGDLLNDMGTEKIRDCNQLDRFKEDWSPLFLAHSSSCENCKCFNFFANDSENDEMVFDFYGIYIDNISSIRNGLLDVDTAKKRDTAELVYLCRNAIPICGHAINMREPTRQIGAAAGRAFFGICQAVAIL
jgi:hypothetical protein